MYQKESNWREGFGRRAGYYIMGIAIGLVILGLFQHAKRRAQEAQGADRAAPVKAPEASSNAAPADPATAAPPSK